MKTKQPNNKTTLMRVLLLIMLLVAGVNNGAWAQTSVAAGGLWSAGTTWVGGIAPVSNANVTINGTVNLDVNVTINSLTIVNGATFNANANNIILIGNWDNGGTFNGGMGTVTFSGTANQSIASIIGFVANNFNNLISNNNSTGTVPGLGLYALIIVNGNLTINGIAALSTNTNNIEIKGNFINNGTFNTPTSPFQGVTFNGIAPQTITGATSFNKLTINNNAPLLVDRKVTLSNSIIVATDLTLTSGRIVLGNNDLTYGSTTAVVSGSSNSWVQTNGLGAFVRSVGGTDFDFPVGDATRYLPVTIFNSVAGASVEFGTPLPALPSAGVGSWFIENGTSLTNFSVNTATALPAGSNIRNYTGSVWNTTAIATNTSGSIYLTTTSGGESFTLGTPRQFAVFAPLSNDYYSMANTTFGGTIAVNTNWSNTLGGTDCQCRPAGNPNANVVIGTHTVTIQNATDIAFNVNITLQATTSILEFNVINTNSIGSLSGVVGSKIKINVPSALPVITNNNFIVTQGTIVEFASNAVFPTLNNIPIGFPNIPTPFPYKNVIISGGVTKNIAGDIIIDENLTIDNTNTLGTNNKNINIKGNWINNGNFSAGTGTATVIFSSSANAQTIGGSNFPITSPFNNLIINNTFTTNPTVSIIAAANELEVKGTLTLTNGRFVIGAKDLRLTNATPSTQLPAVFSGASTSYVETNGGGRLIRSSLPTGDFQFPVGDDIAIRLATINRNVAANTTEATTCRFRAGFTSPSPALPVGATNQAFGTWGIEAQFGGIAITLLSTSIGAGTLIHAENLSSAWIPIGTTGVAGSSYTTTIPASSPQSTNFTFFAPPATSNIFYSNLITSGGDWNVAGSWSSTPTTFTPTTVPAPNATVSIQNGHTINVADVGHIAPSITINIATGGTLSFADGASGPLANNLIDNLNFATGAKVRVNNNILPVFNTSNFGSTNGTIIEFAGTTAGIIPSQFISANYQNLIISGTGTKTLASDIIIDGNLTINLGAIFSNTNSKNIDIKGNWKEDGTFSPGTATATVIFSGSANAQTITGGSLYSFNNVIINNTVTASSAMTVNNITFTSGVLNVIGGNSIDVKGNFINNSTAMAAQTIVAAYVRFNGTGAQTISGSAITNFGGLEIATGSVSNSINLGRDINVRGYFRILTTANTGSFNAGTFNINVSGNWIKEVGSGVFNAGTGTVTFNGANAQTITGNTQFNNLKIDNAANVTLGVSPSDISVITTLTLTSGRLITGVNTVSIINATGSISRASGWVDTSGGGKLSRNILPTSTDFPVGDGSSIRLVKISPTSSGVATAGFVAGAPANPTANAINVFAGTWKLSSANAAIVAFTNAATAPNVKIQRFTTASTWAEEATSFTATPDIYTSTNSISMINETTFALFEIGIPLIAPSTDIKFLPITFNNTANKVTFSWASIANAIRYEVRIGTINENNILVWGTSIIVPAAMLSYVNNNIQYDVTTYYSVRAIDAIPALNSGWSSAVNIFVSSINDPTTSLNNDMSSLVKVFPNPSFSDFMVDFGSLNMSKSVVRVYNAQGKQVFISENNANLMTISLGNFASGIYLLEVQTEKGRVLKRLVRE